jgi:hypothetical protein
MPKQFHDLLFQSRKWHFEGRAAGVDDNRPLGTQLREVQTHGFPEAAFDQVTDVGAAQSTRRRETDARTLGFVLPQVKGGEVSTGIALTSIVDKSEVAGS